jgi:hypothetical protein
MIRICLDVDDWLREHPHGSNPTALICARYVSLLRYISCQSYDAIVIFAHSQGTVITADLLRFLARSRVDGTYEKYDHRLAALDRVPVTLFTVGSPLRQLYADRFPHLYSYASSGMDVSEAGLCFWLNAYRSGDYIGRYLWQPRELWPGRDLAMSWEKLPRDPETNHFEFNLGAGAHTHYWDRTAPSVAGALDRLILDTPKLART